MKLSKKLLSLLLCAIMIFGSIAVGGEGFAEMLDAFSVKASAAVTLTWPVPGHTTISQGFHDGCAIDISDGSIAGATVVAALGGTVTKVYTCSHNTYPNCPTCCYGYGTGVVILGTDGRYYHYAHMTYGSVPSNIYVGASVSAGQKVGAVGNTGCSAGNHLHFGITITHLIADGGYNPSNETYGSAATPSNLSISTDKQFYTVGEKVTFSASGNNVISYYLGVDFYDGESDAYSRAYTSSAFSSTTSKSFTKPGCYSAYVTAVNNAGSTDSYKVCFTVYSNSFVNLGDDFYAYIRSTKSAKLNLCVSGSNVQVGNKSNPTDSTQIWHFIRTSSDNQYKIINTFDEKVLDIYNKSKADGANVQVIDNSSQRFYIRKDGNYYNIVPTYSIWNNLDIADGKDEAGRNIQLWQYNNTQAQKFNIIKADSSLVFTIAYNANGGSGSIKSSTVKYNNTITIAANQFTRPGYVFKGYTVKRSSDGKCHVSGKGWFTEDEISKNKYSKHIYSEKWTGDFDSSWLNGASENDTFTFYAVWEENYVNVVIYSNYADKSASTVDNAVSANKSVVVRDVKYYYSTTYKNGLHDYSDVGDSTYLGRTGYTSTGYWNTKADGTGKRISQSQAFTGKELAQILGYDITSKNVTINLYPEWVKNYTCTFNANGGTGAPENLVGNGNLKIPSTVPKKDGYSFLGWTGNDATSTYVSYKPGDTIKLDRNVTLYAVWNTNTYMVNYNANGGSGAPANQIKNYDKALTLSTTKPTRTGYTFKNWNTKADGTGTSYSSGASYTANAAVTLYAQWTANHTHSYIKSVTNPTCTEKGYTTYTCTCGDSYTGDYVDALGHNYVNGVCTRCGTPDDEYILNEAKKSAKTELELLKNEVVSTEAKEILENAENQIDKAESVDKINTIKNDAIKSAIEADMKSGNNIFDRAEIKTASERRIDYRSKVIIKATATNVPEWYYLVMTVDGKEIKGTNKEVTYEISELKSDVAYTVKLVDSNGNILKDSSGNELKEDGGKITVNAGFFKKIVAFFKGLFKLLPKIEVKP